MCHHKGCSPECKMNGGLLIARVIFAFIMITHGWGKLMGPIPGIEGFTGMLATLHFPAPAIWAWAVALLETVGGAAILLGVWTEKIALLFVLEFLVIVFYVKGAVFQKVEFDLTILALSVVFLTVGAGQYALTKPRSHAAESVKP